MPDPLDYERRLARERTATTQRSELPELPPDLFTSAEGQRELRAHLFTDQAPIRERTTDVAWYEMAVLDVDRAEGNSNNDAFEFTTNAAYNIDLQPFRVRHSDIGVEVARRTESGRFEAHPRPQLPDRPVYRPSVPTPTPKAASSSLECAREMHAALKRPTSYDRIRKGFLDD